MEATSCLHLRFTEGRLQHPHKITNPFVVVRALGARLKGIPDAENGPNPVWEALETGPLLVEPRQLRSDSIVVEVYAFLDGERKEELIGSTSIPLSPLAYRLSEGWIELQPYGGAIFMQARLALIIGVNRYGVPIITVDTSLPAPVQDGENASATGTGTDHSGQASPDTTESGPPMRSRKSVPRRGSAPARRGKFISEEYSAVSGGGVMPVHPFQGQDGSSGHHPQFHRGAQLPPHQVQGASHTHARPPLYLPSHAAVAGDTGHHHHHHHGGMAPGVGMMNFAGGSVPVRPFGHVFFIAPGGHRQFMAAPGGMPPFYPDGSGHALPPPPPPPQQHQQQQQQPYHHPLRQHGAQAPAATPAVESGPASGSNQASGIPSPDEQFAATDAAIEWQLRRGTEETLPWEGDQQPQQRHRAESFPGDGAPCSSNGSVREGSVPEASPGPATAGVIGDKPSAAALDAQGHDLAAIFVRSARLSDDMDSDPGGRMEPLSPSASGHFSAEPPAEPPSVMRMGGIARARVQPKTRRAESDTRVMQSVAERRRRQRASAVGRTLHETATEGSSVAADPSSSSVTGTCNDSPAMPPFGHRFPETSTSTSWRAGDLQHSPQIWYEDATSGHNPPVLRLAGNHHGSAMMDVFSGQNGATPSYVFAGPDGNEQCGGGGGGGGGIDWTLARSSNRARSADEMRLDRILAEDGMGPLNLWRDEGPALSAYDQLPIDDKPTDEMQSPESSLPGGSSYSKGLASIHATVPMSGQLGDSLPSAQPFWGDGAGLGDGVSLPRSDFEGYARGRSFAAESAWTSPSDVFHDDDS